MFGLITLRRHRAEIAALNADRDRLRGERDQFAKDRDAAMAAAKTSARQFTDADAELKVIRSTRTVRHEHYTASVTSTATASAEDIDAWEARVKKHDAWTPDPNPDDRPYEGGSGRPTHPATELLRALDRCSQLETRLAKAEGRRGVLGS